MILRAAFAGVIALGAAVSVRGAESDAEVLSKANEAFAAGAREAATDPARAAVALGPAVSGYRELIEQRGLHSAGLYYNLGNALYLSGDVGRGVASYLRAQRLDPSFPGLEKNLAAARARVAFKDAPASGGAGSVGAAAGSALGWHTAVPRAVRLWACAGAFGLAWVVMLLRLRGGSAWRPPAWAAGGLLVLSGACAGSLWWQHQSEMLRPPAVIVAERVTGRKGPDELGYQPSFTEPLRAGFEVEVLEARGGWVSVRLRDGRTTWVPGGSVEEI